MMIFLVYTSSLTSNNTIWYCIYLCADICTWINTFLWENKVLHLYEVWDRRVGVYTVVLQSDQITGENAKAQQQTVSWDDDMRIFCSESISLIWRMLLLHEKRDPTFLTELEIENMSSVKFMTCIWTYCTTYNYTASRIVFPEHVLQPAGRILRT